MVCVGGYVTHFNKGAAGGDHGTRRLLRFVVLSNSGLMYSQIELGLDVFRVDRLAALCLLGGSDLFMASLLRDLDSDAKDGCFRPMLEAVYTLHANLQLRARKQQRYTNSSCKTHAKRSP